MPTRIKFDESLRELYLAVVKMGSFVESALRKAMTAFRNQDAQVADQIIREDEEINSLHLSIEDQCISLIAREQPVARDLREIMTSIKVASNLERIGDHAVHFAKITKRLAHRPYTYRIDDFQTMADVGIKMLHDAIDAYMEQGAEKAREVSKSDDEIDRLHSVQIQSLLKEMNDKRIDAEELTSFLFLGRFLERLGDHVASICEWVVYGAEGAHVELNI